jgi:hypothetical protein
LLTDSFCVRGGQQPGGFNAAHPRQVDVHEHQVNRRPGDHLKRPLTRFGRPDNNKSFDLVDHGRNRTTERLVVIDHEDPYGTQDITSGMQRAKPKGGRPAG